MPIKLPSFRARRDAYPPDLWTKCPSCEEMLFNKQLDKVQRVCPSCGHHFRLSAEARLAQLLDHGTFDERDAGLQSVDPLGFVDQKAYPDRIAAAQLATGMTDAAVWGTGTIEGRPVAICVMDFGFMGGSMGAVVGEKVTRAAEYALANRVPLIVVSASGGARMQEGTLALMQLAKTVAALERLRAAGVPFISVLTDPTTGGVFASFAALGDVNVAEPNALIGFAGARVTVGHDRPGAAAGLPALGVPVRARLPRPRRPSLGAAGGARRRCCRYLVPGGRRAERDERRTGAAGPAVVPAAVVPLEPRGAGHARRAVAAAGDERQRRRQPETRVDAGDPAAGPGRPRRTRPDESGAGPACPGAGGRARARRRRSRTPSPRRRRSRAVVDRILGRGTRAAP